MKRIILLLVIGAVVFVLSFACASDPKETKPKEGDTTIQETLKVTKEPGSDSTTGAPPPVPPPGIIQESLQVTEEPVEKKDK